MSYDLNFWRYKKDVELNHQEVYEKACCDEESVDGLEALPIDKIVARVIETFLDWKRVDDESFEKEGRGAFQISTTSQMIRFDCYGMDGDDMNLMIDVMLEFDCQLYDPQVPKRYE